MIPSLQGIEVAKKLNDERVAKQFLFEFGPPTCTHLEGASNTLEEVVVDGIREQSISDTIADVPIPPHNGRSSDINIVKDFRWTKTAKDGISRQITPVVTLREYLVTVPAFFQNLSVIGTQISTIMSRVNKLTQSPQIKGPAGEWVNEAEQSDFNDILKMIDPRRIPNALILSLIHI